MNTEFGQADELESYAQYIFLNPYRKGLLPLDQLWPSWIPNQRYKFGFESQVEELKKVPKEWVLNGKDPID